MSIVSLGLTGVEGTGQIYRTEPVSPLPRTWIGFLLAFAFLIGEFIEISQGNEDAIGPFTLVAAIAGWFYWLFCVKRIHTILGQISPHIGGEPTYPIPPGEAVFHHFIPIYNFFWMVRWPREFSEFINQNTSVHMASGTMLGFITLLSAVGARAVDGFIGLTLMFFVILYMCRVLRRAVAEHEQIHGAAGVFA